MEPYSKTHSHGAVLGVEFGFQVGRLTSTVSLMGEKRGKSCKLRNQSKRPRRNAEAPNSLRSVSRGSVRAVCAAAEAVVDTDAADPCRAFMLEAYPAGWGAEDRASEGSLFRLEASIKYFALEAPVGSELPLRAEARSPAQACLVGREPSLIPRRGILRSTLRSVLA